MTLRMEIVWQEAPQFVTGLGNTLWLCIASMALSLVLGALFLLPLTSRRQNVRRAAQAVIDAGRCIPFLLLTYFVYFGLPGMGLVLDKLTAAVTTLVLYNTVYMAEILRAGWASLPAGQTDAARAFGYSGFALLRRIILPQAIVRMLPPFGSLLSITIKDTAIASVIAVPELMRQSETVAGQSFQPIEVYTFAMLAYFLLLFPVTRGVDRFYRSVAHLGRS